MSNLIIYPTDFSTCAENALTFAIGMAQAMKCKLKAVHFVDTREISASTENSTIVMDKIAQLVSEARGKLDIIRDTSKKHQIDCEIETLSGSMNLWFSEYIKKLNPLLVVMGTTGSDGFENKIMGSLTYRVIKNTEFPVLAVPVKATYKGFRKMIFASRFQKKDEDSIGLLAEIAKSFEADIDVAHVFDGAVADEGEHSFLNDFKEYISKKVNYPKMDFRLLHHDDAEERLAILVKESNADLLALITRKRNFFDRLFQSSLTKKMIYHTDIPLLAFS